MRDKQRIPHDLPILLPKITQMQSINQLNKVSRIGLKTEFDTCPNRLRQHVGPTRGFQPTLIHQGLHHFFQRGALGLSRMILQIVA